MLKRIVFLAIVSIFIFQASGAWAADLDQPTVKPMEKTKDRLSRGMNNILYGPVEMPNNIDQTKTKGTQLDKCSTKTRSGVERGIARIVGGAWQLATFWYSDHDFTPSSSSTK